MNKIIRNLLFICTLSLVVLFTACTAKNFSINDTSKTEKDNNIKNSVILSNEVFSISPSKSFDNQYDTKVDNYYIELYDKDSINNGYPGLLFAICAYENPDDWAGGPHEKVGELKLNNGKLYDIIIGYPTESQFGFDTIEMPANYKTMYDARYDVVSTVTGLNGEKIIMGAGSKGDGLYNNILQKHLNALNDSLDGNELESNEMSPMYNVIKSNDNEYMNKIAYAYCDVNLDGIDELLIGEIADGDFESIIYDMYTMVNRKPEHVLSGWDRNRYYISENYLIINEYSGGANLSGTDIYNLNTNSTELTFQLGYKYDGYENESNPWFITYSKNDENADWENVSEDKYNEFTSRFENHKKINYIPFSKIK